jgi:hypothetical protein
MAERPRYSWDSGEMNATGVTGGRAGASYFIFFPQHSGHCDEL